MRLFAIAALFSVLAAGANAAAPSAPRVLASIKPVHSIVAAVMGDIGAPELLIAGAASPHSYALRPSDAQKIARADVIFWIGPVMETFLETPLKNLAPRARKIALMNAAGVTQLQARTGGLWDPAADDHGHAEGGVDGHVWLNPANAIAMARAAAMALATADGANAARYASNAEAFAATTRTLDDATHARLAAIRDRPYIVFHDAFRYFESHYGLSPVGAVTVASERPPGARRVAEIRARIKEGNALCLFSTPQFPPRLVATLTEGSSARTAPLDDVGADIPAGPAFYGALLTRITDSMVACLVR
ncbi:MAG: zinc ABC transporter substrate-binding protein [Alphaproteobacteria bacterium]|nr:zinc ABC transporter substrate-binding protein [Alphaproteobacteria bacterium]